MSIRSPYLMFLGDAPDQLAAKTADGVKHWRPEWCVAQMRLPGCNADLGLPDMSISEAAAAGVKTVVLGVANRGGVIGEAWMKELVAALESGMDIASGLHTKLAGIPALEAAASRTGQRLIEVRHPRQSFSVASGVRRSGKRLLTVGTDCSVGKMFTSLAIEREMKARGMQADFRATGQTGIFIAGDGVSVDAVVADFISGATEWLTPENDPDHWDVVEGQGSLFHASYAGVSLGLLHGAQPDAMVMCHEPTRQHMRGIPSAPIPDLQECVRLNEACAQLTRPGSRVVGVSVNTAALDEQAANVLLAEIESDLGMPAVDAYRFGAGRLVDELD
ncbi:MAG: N-acetyltransferase DgcN [Pseudomonadota bacterium]